MKMRNEIENGCTKLKDKTIFFENLSFSWKRSNAQTDETKKIIHVCIKLIFEPHNELTFVSLLEGVGGNLGMATKDEIKVKVVLWKVTDMRDTTFRKHQFLLFITLFMGNEQANNALPLFSNDSAAPVSSEQYKAQPKPKPKEKRKSKLHYNQTTMFTECNDCE